MSLKIFSRINKFYLINIIQRAPRATSSIFFRNFSALNTESSKFASGQNGNFLIQKRQKYDKKQTTKQSTEEDSDDELSEFDDDVDKQKIVKLKVQSLRADLLLKVALGIARNKIETAFYEGKIRINMKKIQKKSVHCNEGDILDIIKNESPTNPDHWIIGRLEILSVKTDGEEFIYLTVKRFRSLAVEKAEFK